MKLLGSTVPEPLEEAVRACRTHFLLVAVFSALINILHLAPTIYMMQIYDRVVPTGGVTTLFWMTVIIAVAIGTLSALDALRLRLMMRASLRLDRYLSAEILDRLMARATMKPGDPTTSQAIREFDVLRQTLGGQPAITMFDIPWTPLYFIVAFVIHPSLGIVILVGATILVCLAVVNERTTKAMSQEAMKATAASYAAQETAVAHGETIRALGMRRAIVNRQLGDRANGLRLGAEAQFNSGRYTSIVKFVRMFMQSLALGLGALLAINGQISVGAIIAASVLLSRALQPVEQSVSAWPMMVQARQAMKTIGTLFSTTQSMHSPRTALPAPVGRLELDRVCIRTPDLTGFILKTVSLKVEPGEVVGIIGPSGAGKTTLARVLAGALPPDLGGVRVDCANVTDWDPELLARHIGYLPQETALLPGTISENISRFAAARGTPAEKVAEEVIRAANAAGVHDLILRLPDGYDAEIDLSGRGLSTGQAQRVGLARALYGDPAIIILDEPNSALDSDGEDALGRAIAAAKQRGAAVVIVAHRAGILASTDRLVVINEGMIERDGARHQVMEELRETAARANVVNMKGRS